ncbi:MAG: alpha/beta hydrolase [Anaerolineae bacterium]|nr:alpha/beta hydrolase [Anaerolineae bacterium]
MRRLHVLLLAMFGGFVTLLAIGLIYQSQAAARDEESYPPSGRMVDVGGYALHIQCEGDGSPTIVVESGSGTWSLMWADLLPRMTERSRTCVYDRAGYGWSESSGEPHTAINSADDLRAVLTSAQITPPYVLVGHSYGGWVVRVFQDRYPDEVVGVVLAEASHPEQWVRLPASFIAGANRQAQALNVMGGLAVFGLPRLIVPDDPYLSDALQPIYRAAMGLGRSYEALGSEFAQAVLSGQQAAQTSDFGDKPLAVISAENSLQAFAVIDPNLPFDEANQVWRTLQEELAQLSTNSVHLVSTRGDHYIHATDPDLVLAGLDWVMDALERE